MKDLTPILSILTLDLTLVTHKLRAFERVPGLRLEDWLERKDE